METIARSAMSLSNPPMPRLAPFVPATGAALHGAFEVRDAQGRVRRLQEVVLPLPPPLLRLFARGAPDRNWIIEGVAPWSRLTLWTPRELIELQVGYRWHGFNGKRLTEWDERFVVFAEADGDPLALCLDEVDGPVWFARRGEGRYRFTQEAPTLGAFLARIGLPMAVE